MENEAQSATVLTGTQATELITNAPLSSEFHLQEEISPLEMKCSHTHFFKNIFVLLNVELSSSLFVHLSSYEILLSKKKLTLGRYLKEFYCVV